MNARELRIGNYVYPFDDINSISQKVIFRDCIKICSDDFEYTNHLHPIELTEEWLEKLGFKKYYNSWQFGNITFELPFKTWSFFGITIDKQPKYVHEIQNLVYALTGKEL